MKSSTSELGLTSYTTNKKAKYDVLFLLRFTKINKSIILNLLCPGFSLLSLFLLFSFLYWLMFVTQLRTSYIA